jgi:IclR family transcriptional regulator, KDG regulon repressor
MTVQSVDRTFDILELLALNPNGLSVGAVSENLELHKSTVSRLLQVLRNRGYIDKDPSTGQYRMGLKVIELAGSQLENIELRLEARNGMHALAQNTGHTVFLAVERNNEAVYIDKMEAYNSLRRYSIIGTTVPLYCTALGKALLMGKSESEIDILLNQLTIEKHGPNTLLEPIKIKEDLYINAERGYTIDNEENEVGVCCIGAPIFDYQKRTVAAISVSGQRDTMTDTRVQELSREVSRTALTISEHLGYKPKI